MYDEMTKVRSLEEKQYFGYAIIGSEGPQWAVMPQNVCDEKPPVIVFDTRVVAEKYKSYLPLKQNWKLSVLALEDLEEMARDGWRFSLVLSCDAEHVQRLDATIGALQRHQDGKLLATGAERSAAGRKSPVRVSAETAAAMAEYDAEWQRLMDVPSLVRWLKEAIDRNMLLPIHSLARCRSKHLPGCITWESEKERQQLEVSCEPNALLRFLEIRQHFKRKREDLQKVIENDVVTQLRGDEGKRKIVKKRMQIYWSTRALWWDILWSSRERSPFYECTELANVLFHNWEAVKGEWVNPPQAVDDPNTTVDEQDVLTYQDRHDQLLSVDISQEGHSEQLNGWAMLAERSHELVHQLGSVNTDWQIVDTSAEPWGDGRSTAALKFTLPSGAAYYSVAPIGCYFRGLETERLRDSLLAMREFFVAERCQFEILSPRTSPERPWI